MLMSLIVLHLAGGPVESNMYRRFDTWNDSRDPYRVFLTWVKNSGDGRFCVMGHALFYQNCYFRFAISQLLKVLET